MKKLLVVAAAFFLIVPAAASAQGIKMTQSEFNKAGKISISGNIASFDNIQGDDENDPESSKFGIAPTVGYMVIDNLQVNLGFGYSVKSNEETADTEETQWNVTPGVRYYLDMLSKNNLFPSLGASYMIGSKTAPDATQMDASDVESGLSALRVGAGLTQAMGAAQGGYLTLNLDYVMATETPDGRDDDETAGLDVSVGFGLYF